LLQQKNDSDEVEELRQKLHDAELESTTALSQAAEAETALTENKTKLTDSMQNEEDLRAELSKLQAEDRRTRKEEKARLAEVQESEDNLRKENEKLQWAHKQGQMYKKKMEDAEKELKELKQQLELKRQHIETLEVDEQKFKSLQEHAALRDNENIEVHEQNKQLMLTVSTLEHDWEQSSAENAALEHTVAELEAALEATRNETAGLMGHNNHKQKVEYHKKIKEENSKLMSENTKLLQRLSQFESGQRGNSLLEALAAFGSGNGNSNNNNGPELSVCSARGMEPRTPNPKGSSSQAAATNPRTPGRPTSRGPLSARTPRGQAAEAVECPRCAMDERKVERTIKDFQHFVTLIERAAFVGDVGEHTTDPNAVLQKLRNVVAVPGCGADPRTPSTALPTRTAWDAAAEPAES